MLYVDVTACENDLEVILVMLNAIMLAAENKLGTTELILGIAVVVMAVFLIIAVLLQSGKDTQMSGAITGSAETFFGQGKGNRRDKLLSKLTVAVTVIFALVVIAMYVIVS